MSAARDSWLDVVADTTTEAEATWADLVRILSAGWAREIADSCDPDNRMRLAGVSDRDVIRRCIGDEDVRDQVYEATRAEPFA